MTTHDTNTTDKIIEYKGCTITRRVVYQDATKNTSRGLRRYTKRVIRWYPKNENGSPITNGAHTTHFLRTAKRAIDRQAARVASLNESTVIADNSDMTMLVHHHV
jgi:hypothetical protein